VQLLPAQLSAISEATKTRLRDQLLGAGDLNSRSMIRNLVAYLCFVAEERVPLEENPFAKVSGDSALLKFGAVDDLRASGVVTSCEVPLALLYWTFDGVGFLDSWAVRRRALPQTVSPAWPGFGHWRRRIEAEARFLQFQNHLAWLISEVPNPALIQATAFFRYLPPSGFLPIAQGTNAGVSETTFFNGLTARDPVFMEGSRVPPLIDRSFAYPALDLDDKKVIWRYYARENRMPAPGEQQPSEPPYLVFAKGHLPYQGDAQFDIAHWDFSNYAPGVSF
jgi:hypothetical protein